MKETRWWTYLSSIMGEDNNTEAAKKSGISSSNFTRWKKGARADPDFVVKIARAYRVNVLEALVAAEFITTEEAQLTTITPQLDLTKVESQDLLAELQHRINTIQYLINLEEGGDKKLEALIEQRSNVIQLQSARRDIPRDAVADQSTYNEEENTEFDD